jgi:hypothetical protein
MIHCIGKNKTKNKRENKDRLYQASVHIRVIMEMKQTKNIAEIPNECTSHLDNIKEQLILLPS